MTPHYQDDDVTLYAGDCLDVLREMPDASVDAVVTDPPYGIEFMDHDWDAPWRQDGPAGRVRGGAPDAGAAMRAYQSWCQAWATECLRVLKPGGYLLAFGGTRTYHRLTCAIEDAGFELRDSIDWIYGSGFPKSLDVGARAGEAWAGWGSALKPAHEPIAVARKAPVGTLVANVLEHGTGALNIDATRARSGPSPSIGRRQGAINHLSDRPAHEAEAAGRLESRTSPERYREPRPGDEIGRWPANILLTHSADCELVGQVDVATDTHFPAARGRGGISVPGHAGQNGLTERTPGTERIDAYDCAPDCPVAELDRQSGAVGAFAPVRGSEPSSATADVYGVRKRVPGAFHGDAGGASRFFPIFRYEAKAGVHERPRDGETAHPTVKPLELMRWLVRLVVPRGATVLDLFAGSGTTGEACIIEGMKAILVEREPKHLPLIVTRLSKGIGLTLELDA